MAEDASSLDARAGTPLPPEAVKFFRSPAKRGEIYVLLMQMTVLHSKMISAVSLLAQGKNHEAEEILAESTERLGRIQKAFDVIPGFSDAS